MNLYKYFDLVLSHMIDSKELAVLMLVLFILAIITLFVFFVREKSARLKDRLKFEEKLDREQEKRLEYWKLYATEATKIMAQIIEIKKESNALIKDLARSIHDKTCFNCNTGKEQKHDAKGIQHGN